jgi:hypothetical protein
VEHVSVLGERVDEGREPPLAEHADPVLAERVD